MDHTLVNHIFFSNTGGIAVSSYTLKEE